MITATTMTLMTLMILVPRALPETEVEVPDVVTLSAYLDEGGVPLHRSIAARFVFWDAPMGGEAVWRDDQELVVEHGVLVAELGGQANPLPPVLFAGPRWLEVVIDDVSLEPRARIASAPYAIQATRAGECDSLGGLAPDDVATTGALQTPGAARVSFANVVDVPAPLRGVADGTAGLARESLAGEEVLLFRVPAACEGGGTVTLASSCPSLSCGAGQFRLRCDGSCGAGDGHQCPTEPIGWLLAL